MPGEDREQLATPPPSRRPGAPPAGGLDAPRHAAGYRVAGKYRLDRILGRGGMGDVWLAHNETLDIEVAVKLLRREADGPEAGNRFLREARAAARLSHPAIVRIFDFGLADQGEPFIVMERLVGEDLASALQRRGRLPAVHAVRTLLPIANALVVAHAKGVVHRDLKPENVFLARGPGDRIAPKVVDFGVAKLDLPMQLQLTKEGVLLGSPAYMPPEQAQGMGVDHRADVWSLAVVLYEMVAGVRPFDGKTHNAILIAIGRDVPRPITELSAGDDVLWAIIAKGLRKDRRERWDSMRSFGEALARWALSQGATEDISGQTIEAVWGHRSDNDGPSASGLPPPLRRDAIVTLRRFPVRPKPWRAALAAAAVASVIGGALLWRHATAAPELMVPAPAASMTGAAVAATAPAPSPETSASTTPSSDAPPPPVTGAAGSRRHRKGGRTIPVKTLSQLPVDGRSAGAARTKPPHSAKTKATKVSLREQ